MALFHRPKVSGAGTKITDVLALIFIIAKINHFIAWHWAWVLSPLWVPLALWLLIEESQGHG